MCLDETDMYKHYFLFVFFLIYKFVVENKTNKIILPLSVLGESCLQASTALNATDDNVMYWFF